MKIDEIPLKICFYEMSLDSNYKLYWVNIKDQILYNGPFPKQRGHLIWYFHHTNSNEPMIAVEHNRTTLPPINHGSVKFGSLQ